MKKLLCLLCFIQWFGGIAHASFFNQGDTTTLSFSTLPYIGTTNNSDVTWITFNGTQLNNGDSFRLDLFNNISDSNPLFSETVVGPGTFGGYGFVREMSIIIGDPNPVPGPLLWEDLEGKISLTMLSGSMSLDTLDVSVSSGGHVWGETLAVTPTPIPATAVLLGSGLMGLIGFRRRVVA